MGVNKVIFGNVTLIDTSEVTVQPETLFQGETALGADGEVLTGNFTIQTELTQQDSLISRIKAALEGKAAGGGSAASVDTCTLQINYNGYESGVQAVRYQTFENGVLTPHNESVSEAVINNVVCNSMFAVTTNRPNYIPVGMQGFTSATIDSETGGAYYREIYIVTAGRGETAILDIVYNDW